LVKRRAKALFVTTALVAFFGLAASASADVPPVLTIDAPSAVSYQSAHVSGTIDPEGSASDTFWRFDYSTNPSDPFSWTWSSVSGSFGPGGTDPVAVGGTLEFLQPGTEYAVRLVASSGGPPVETEAPYPTFTTLAVVPPTVTLSPPTSVTPRAAHFEAEIDPGGNDPAFNTSWFLSCTPACLGVEGSVPGDGAVHDHIPVDASGLMPNTEYEAILYASNLGGTESSAPQTFTTGTEQPTIEKVYARPATTEAELFAEVDPGGLETTYYFEYGTTSSYGQSTDPKALSAGSTEAKAIVAGLSPETTYHYRLVAENADGVVVSDDHSFTTESATAAPLPDGRAYELVSNEDSNFGDVRQPISSDQGGAVTYLSPALDSSRSAFLLSVSVANRGVDGWSTRSLDTSPPPVNTGILRIGGAVVAISEDLERAVVWTYAGIDPQDQNEGIDLYLIDADTGAATWVSKPPNVPATKPANSIFAGASRDLRRIYWLSNAAPENQPVPGPLSPQMYEWDEGSFRHISVLPDGTEFLPGLAALTSQFSPFQFGDVNWMPAPHGGNHPVSDDGETLFFSFFDRSGSLGASREGEIIDVSFSQKAGSEGDPCISPAFIGASHDGDFVYFTCAEELTEDATEGGGLYGFRLSTGELTQLTPDAGDPNGLNMSSGIMSDDASHVYFVSTAALTSAAQPGSPNLYVYADGETRFIAAVPADTQVERASRSGRFALLVSNGSLAGADNAGHTAIYRYDDASGEIACVSCRPDGSPSEGDASLADLGPPSLNGRAVPRNITDTGDVFFASGDRLVAKDVTEAWDVYEYTDGRPHLLSSGHSQYDSYLGDNSDSGSDAFFTTRSSLVPSDQDGGLADLYDARVGGGFPESQPATVECREDACQGSVPATRGGREPGTRSLQDHRKRDRSPSLRVRAKKGLPVLLLRVDGPGKAIVQGKGIYAKKRYLKQAGTYRIRLHLRPWARRALAAKGQFAVRAKVTFQPRNGRPVTRTATVRFKE